MNKKANRPCMSPHCVEFAIAGRSYCKTHFVPAPRSPEAIEYRKLYQTKDWKTGRKAFLLSHPLCAECSSRGQIVAATVVDHITPHRGDVDLFFDMDNWQALCKTCHDIKSAREGPRFGLGPVEG